MIAMSQYALRPVAPPPPAVLGALRLSVASGDLAVNAASLIGQKARRVLPILDQNGNWIALLRIEQEGTGLRLRTEILGVGRRPQAGAWISANDDDSVELNWDIDDNGRCRYLAMNAY